MTGEAIDGTTRLIPLLGDPVRQVRAPTLLNPILAERGSAAVVVPAHVTAADLPQVFAGLTRLSNVVGLLVTVPHKAAALALADEASPTAVVSGGANALRRMPGNRWYADMFDGAGFVAGLRAAGFDPAGTTVALIGAGGAGSAIAAALLAAAVSTVNIHDTDRTRLDTVLRRLSARYPGRVTDQGLARLPSVALAVNATPLGLRPQDPLPLPPELVAPGCLVADVIMDPPRTRLLTAAQALGLAVHEGRPMLDHQVAQYLEFFGL